jgi:hypothetical protein
MPRPRRQQTRLGEIADIRRMGCQQRREGSKEDEAENDDKADDGETVRGKPPPGDIGTAKPGLQARLRPVGQEPFAAGHNGLVHRVLVLGSSMR